MNTRNGWAAGLAALACMLLGGPAMADGEADECGAAALQDRIGESVSGTTAEDLRIGGEPVIGSEHVRVVGKDQPMTMDFRADRLTIVVDEDGTLLSARCV